MLKKTKRSKPQVDSPSQDQLRRNIKSQTEDFLRLGGVIKSIPNGVSGYAWGLPSSTKSKKNNS